MEAHMKSKIGAAALMGVVALALLATTAAAQCTGYPGPMIKFDSNGYAYETAYNPATLVSSAGSQMVFVGKVSLFCNPFTDLDPASTTIEYTFVWDGLASQGTVTTVQGPVTRYNTHYLGGMFHVYAGSPPDIPGSLPALPAAGIIPGTYANGTLILEGTLDDLLVAVVKTGTSYSSSFRTNYHCTGGSLLDRVGGATDLLSGVWCPVPPSGSPSGTCTLPVGWSAHASGKWDAPSTTPAASRSWGMIKTMYR
jgi:hypothetical protein